MRRRRGRIRRATCVTSRVRRGVLHLGDSIAAVNERSTGRRTTTVTHNRLRTPHPGVGPDAPSDRRSARRCRGQSRVGAAAAALHRVRRAGPTSGAGRGRVGQLGEGLVGAAGGVCVRSGACVPARRPNPRRFGRRRCARDRRVRSAIGSGHQAPDQGARRGRPTGGRRGVRNRTAMTGWLRRILHAGPCGVRNRTAMTGWVRRIRGCVAPRRALAGRRAGAGDSRTEAGAGRAQRFGGVSPR